MPTIQPNGGGSSFTDSSIKDSGYFSISPPVTQLSLSLVTSATCMNGGTDVVVGVGQQWTYVYSITTPPVAGDKFTVTITDMLGTKQIGSGDVTGIVPTFCFTYGNKEYLLAGPTVYCSELNQPTIWNDPEGVGNGFITMTNFYATPEDLVAIAPFQGRLAIFSRQTTQIWQVAPAVADWQQIQVLQSIGTVNALSVQPIGELDVLFLSDSGIRSLKVRDTTLNAYVDDLGSPIDSLVIASVLASGFSGAASIVEPTSLRYWLFLNSTIYVFSRYLSSRVNAWSKYLPTDSITQTAITPSKFGIMAGKVYCRAGDKIYVYGGTNGTTYDASVAEMETPYLDFKSPGTRKMFNKLDIACSGAWNVKFGTDPISDTLETTPAYINTGPSFDIGSVPLSAQGTHFKIKAVTTGTTEAIFSSAVVHYEGAEEV